MPWIDYQGFVGPSMVAQSPTAMHERTVNFYVERQELATGKSRDVLYPSPGVTQLDMGTRSPGRAHWAQDGREFCVLGDTFYSVSAAGALTSIGTVAVDANPATICSNGDAGGQIFVTSGDNGYIYNVNTGAFSQVRTGATTMGAHLDGFFLALDAATSTLFISASLDGTSWDPTQFAQRSIQTDPWVSMMVADRYIWLFGTQTSEIWYDAGTAPFPFKPHPSGLVSYGIAAPWSARVVAGGVMWLSATAYGRGDVLRAEGFTPTIVSTFATQIAFATYGDLAKAIGDTYEALGHVFYLLTFPQSMTWTYDATPTLQLPFTMRWAERSTWISEENREIAWRPLFHAFAFNEHRVLDRESGALYRLDTSVMTDVDGRPVRRLRRPPTLWFAAGRGCLHEFDLGLEPGLGLVTGQGSDPLVALRISRDAGKTWGDERTRSAGVLGDYDKRVYWNRCGSIRKGNGFQPELVMTDPIPWRVTGARVRLTAAA
jgi:hypothetical protein